MQARKFMVLSAVQIVAAGYLLWILFKWSAPWNMQRYIGTALVLIGVGFIVVARYQLGRSFSVRPEAHELVTTGLYSKIRNPIYVFGMFLFAGVALIVQKPVFWLLLVLVIIVQTVRARREARVLEAAFGDAYREYRRKTWF
jgi:protein-S-isoprenylcysteine O-methyltransferase Ste14